jgi:hypothetical protein
MPSTNRRQFEYLTTPHKSLMRILKRGGPRNASCGIPGNSSYGEESPPEKQA